ncbi:heat- and acid-stable phosphoprotein [Physocladia obscura]|uniref:Heat- and acid-stable phosphoprotein n=1 Tax=Physocladia obscura TaxID=109957 RepID=A0AAD5XDD3_9FUNG|nr:heat- and acid-stable phosphoprotein [Physocladia obscura]
MSGRGKGKFNKTKRGGGHHFTDDTALEQSIAEIEKLKLQRRKQEAESGSEGESDLTDSDTGLGGGGGKKNTKPAEYIYRSADRPVTEIGTVAGGGDGDGDGDDAAPFESHNANRVAAAAKPIKAADLNAAPASANLSRREKEALEAERKKAAFWKAQMEGKTDVAKADLARLAIIRKQREDAARKKQDEVTAKASASEVKTASMNAGKVVIVAEPRLYLITL